MQKEAQPLNLSENIIVLYKRPQKEYIYIFPNFTTFLKLFRYFNRVRVNVRNCSFPAADSMSKQPDETFIQANKAQIDIYTTDSRWCVSGILQTDRIDYEILEGNFSVKDLHSP